MSFFRYDGSVRTPLGFAVAGASIGVYTQPATFPGGTNAVGTPLATIWSASTSNSATITNIVFSNGFVNFTFSATPTSDVVAGSYISVSGVNPSAYNAIWLVYGVLGNVVSVSYPTNPGSYISGGTAATSALPNPLLTDNLGNYFFYASNGVYTVQEFDPTYSRISPLILADQQVVSPGGGSVTSVAMTGDGILYNAAITGSPITTAGTLVPVLLTEPANQVFAGPTSGSAAVPGFRSLVSADFPAGVGTVSSVAATISTDSFVASSVTGSPVTASGTLAFSINFSSQSANFFLCGPDSGGSAAPTFRAIEPVDIPASLAYLVNAQSWTALQTFNAHIGGNSDVVGTLTVGAGTASESFTFAAPYASAPVVVLTPASSPSAAGIGTYWVVSSTTGFTVNCDNPAPASPPFSFTFNYLVVANPS